VKKNGPWTILESAVKYRGKFILVEEAQVIQPDGEPGEYATVTMKPGVCILPVDDEGNVYLTTQFRYAVGRDSIEVCAGSVDEGEEPRAAAEREAREELGIEAEEWIDLGSFDLDTSVIHCPVSLFAARGLSFGETEQEGTETIRPLKLPLDEAVRKVMDSEITHGPSCVLILKAARALEAQAG